MTFKTLETADILAMRPYFERGNLRVSAYSGAFKLMWNLHYGLQFAEVENCIVYREKYRGKTWFHYPLSKDDEEAELRAVAAVEDYCKAKNIRLHWANVPRHKLFALVERYGSDLNIKSYLKWRDYIYEASDFVNYPGKKFAGQRNHVNKFNRLYPNEFVRLSGDDRAEIFAFFKKYESRQLAKKSVIAREEMQGAYAVLPYIDELGLKVGALKSDGEIIAVAMGEVCGDTMQIHIEKALAEYEGVYPAMAQAFARAFCGGVRFINREDDSGDAGLRKSKLQYNPVDRADKYNLTPLRAIDEMQAIPSFRTERLEIKAISEESMIAVYRLETDADRNKYWGYDWRDSFSGTPTPEYFLECLRQDFARRDEVPMGVYSGENLIGEVVLHNFGYRRECEVGIRLLPEYEGRGYAREAVEGAINYAFFELNCDKVEAKCFKANGRSKNCLLGAGMRACGEDDVYYYFYKTAAM